MQCTKKQLITTWSVRRRVCVREPSASRVLFDNNITVLLSSPEKTCIIIWRKTTRGARILYACLYYICNMGGVTSLRKRRAEYILCGVPTSRVSVMRGRDGRTEINARITVYDMFMRLYYTYYMILLYYTSVILYSSTYVMC